MPNITYNFLDSYDSLSIVSVPLCVIDYTNTNTTSCYCGGLGSINVYPDFTNLLSLDFIENWGYYIDFGDGTVMKELTATHAYNTPGEYRVTLIVTDSGSNMFKSVYQPTIKAYNIIPDTVCMTYLSGNTIISSNISTPIIITRYNSYQTYPVLSSVGYNIKLSVSGNNSQFITPGAYSVDQYSHLRLFSTFLTSTDFTPVQSVKTSSDEIYAQINPISNKIVLYPSLDTSIPGYPTFFVGTSGIVTVYYYEDFNSTTFSLS